MRKMILLVGILLTSTGSFAMQPAQLNTLGSAWKAKPVVQPKHNNDITIVYGGADISRRPTLVPHTTTA
jgi:hypothetical protein